jgi:hypothetical protein
MLRSAEILLGVMCADACSRGIKCTVMPVYGPLPLLPADGLDSYYQHVEEYTAKIVSNLKSAGCWQADPRLAWGGKAGIQMVAPGVSGSRGVEVSEQNKRLLCTSFHRWNPFDAPLPVGTKVKMADLLNSHTFSFTEDRAILLDHASWIWESPTWMISGVQTQTMQVGCEPS